MAFSSASQFIGMAVAGYRLEQVIELHPWGPIFLARGPESKQYTLRFVGEPSPQENSHADSGEHIVFLGRFQQEANRITALRHNHILPLLDYGTSHAVPYLVYPALSLPSLRAALLKQGADDKVLDLQTVGRSLEQIASALAFAHEHAVLHHNLSTQNIYMLPNQRLLVGEFGMLHIIKLSRPDLQTYLGSSESSAPEQLLGKSIDTSADIYALGTILYRLLTGHAPFEGKTRADIARQHLYAAPPTPGAYRNDLPSGLDEVLAQALAKDPAQRYPNPEALVQAYYQVVAPGQYRSLPPAQPRTTSVPIPAVKAASQKAHATLDPVPPGRQNNGRGHAMRSRRNVVAAFVGAGLTSVAALLIATHTLNLPGLTGQASANTSPTTGNNLGNVNTPPTTGNSANTQSNSGNGGTQIARTTDVPVNSAKTFPLTTQQNPGILIHLPDQSFVAYNSTCTHAGCAVQYNSKNHHLECPCHGAVFDPAQKAAVLAGPAPSPLAPINIVVNADGTIVAK
jgi:serine/threonine protein kinase